MSLKYLLPCCTCRENIVKHFAKIPFHGQVSKWIYDIHNLVNDDLGIADANRPAFSDVQKKYKNEKGTAAEWIFIRGIAKCHPGNRQITPEYEAALTVFMKGVLETNTVPFNVRSRSAFKTWITEHR